ncbi:MAG: patatin-like phospholipase family protein [Alphaproteobacteria bacterium]|jgi:NTE family protein|nr:patatin-like phospholipase family protein [Alphaproteobacteria bacterium]
MQKKKVALALQGGGAHGAFAWGVADRLLEDGRFDIEGVSGTSAGGMNAASIIQGLIKGGTEGARATLKDYWRSMSELSKKISPYSLNPIDKANKYYNLDHSLGFLMMGKLQEHFSPYDLNPSNKNPFGDFVKGFFDFATIRESTERRIFLGTTHVKSGKIKIFTNKDICSDVLMASACLPFMFQAVQVDGEYYWDGGFIANPAIFPLISECSTSDIIVVQLTKTYREELPKTKADIVDRLKEITYNGCLVREMRAIYFITKLIDDGKIKEGTMKRMNMHMIKNEDSFKNLNLSSALNTDWDFLMMLHNEGRKAADRWINDHYDDVGSKTHKLDDGLFKDFVS